DEAAKAYHRAITMVPRLERALSGLRALLDDPSARGPAVRGLAKAYELTDDWNALLSLLEPRLELASGDLERVELLREAAALHERRAGEANAAFEDVRRALGYAPASSELEAELLRLAHATERYNAAAGALGHAAEAIAQDKPDRAAELRRQQAGLLESRVGDVGQAHEAWMAALALTPDSADTAAEAIRTGAAAGRWDGVASALVTVSVKRGAFQGELFAQAEALASQAGAFGALAASLAERIPGPGRVDAELGRALEARVAAWLRDRMGDHADAASAEAALLRALEHARGHVPTLQELARLQWAAPGRPLIDTLMQLAGAFPDDLDPLSDAARTALDPVGDRALADGILERLLRSARRLWEGGQRATGQRAADAMAVFALDALIAHALEAGDAARAVDLLVDGARMPVAPERSREMRRRAGELCRERLGDEDRALRLLQSVVDESVEDAGAVEQLCGLLEGRGRLAELLALRQRQLGTQLDEATRLTVRLEIARVLGAIESQGGRVVVLRQNLKERPGHDASIESLGSILRERARHRELAELYTTQAQAIEQQGDPHRAASLWSRAASLFEGELADVDGALRAHRKVVGLEPTKASLDALARLHLERGEPAIAAEWLGRRLDASSEDERTEVARKLAAAHLSAGHNEQATAVLARLLASDPGVFEAREQLAGLYREARAWEPLARLLAEGAAHVPDEETTLEYIREAARLYEHELGQPDRAIPVLQQGVQLAPDDNDLKAQLALGLRVAGRLDEARVILEQLIESFGRRRSPERAAVHYQLAQVAHAAKDLDAALEQLEQAKKMDPSNAAVLRMSGQLAREAGQHDRAEKAYRALLLVVRRLDPAAPEVTVSASEVLYELSLLATEQRDAAQAKELLETALATAAGHDAEAERLARDLVRRGELELALRPAELRLAAAEEPASQARMLGLKSEVLAAQGKHQEALDALLRAISQAPEQGDLHTRCRALAKQMGATDQYASALKTLSDKARRKEDSDLAGDLLLRLAEVTETDLGDLDGASRLYGRVEKLGVRLVEAWMSLARVADARGDSDEEVRVLRQLVEAESDAIPGEARTRALYRVAEVELASEEIDEGLATLRAALGREPRYARAGAILQSAVAASPEHDGLLATYEEIARASGDPALVLDWLERRAARPDATIDLIKEGVERADDIQAGERAERLLERGVEIARGQEAGLAGELWLPIALADRRQAAGDTKAAMQWMRLAADQAPEGEEQTRLWTRLAALAASEGGDIRMAAESYRGLLASDPTNRELWEPLVGVYVKLRDRAAVDEVVASTLEALLDSADRNALRMLQANYLLDVEGAREDAIAVLKTVIDEDPDHV
ncbi:MAG: tetratricopeptide repeat protein, partial [Sandaracinaceae bacterium]|nr:tetratricopeptide repeat protein [Sandaracinaceae bacterium]